MNKKWMIPILLVTTACAVPDNFPGSVYEITELTVTIRGAYDMSPEALLFTTPPKPASPNRAMRAQAEEICPGAEYVSANPYPYDYYTFLYLFRCP